MTVGQNEAINTEIICLKTGRYKTKACSAFAKQAFPYQNLLNLTS